MREARRDPPRSSCRGSWKSCGASGAATFGPRLDLAMVKVVGRPSGANRHPHRLLPARQPQRMCTNRFRSCPASKGQVLGCWRWPRGPPLPRSRQMWPQARSGARPLRGGPLGAARAPLARCCRRSPGRRSTSSTLFPRCSMPQMPAASRQRGSLRRKNSSGAWTRPAGPTSTAAPKNSRCARARQAPAKAPSAARRRLQRSGSGANHLQTARGQGCSQEW
mmetsp:Transcript_110833/g.236754  ORF Transcript_110833/g.236754 Transcript_110833/m.236754 type:complete len:221 (-) Transcript_110833:583-1245(-)